MLQLKEFWTLEEHHQGETTFTHFAEGTAKKNRMQSNDFVDCLMYRRGVTCFSCRDVRGTSHNADLIKPAQQLCLTCHGVNSPNGPRAASIEAHTHHAPGSRGSQCVECHMSKIEQTIADVTVRSHSFKFITPSMAEQYKIPNPCTVCHTSQTTEWAKEHLKTGRMCRRGGFNKRSNQAPAEVNVILNVLPEGPVLCSARRPRFACTAERAIANPRPTPPAPRLRARSTR